MTTWVSIRSSCLEIIYDKYGGIHCDYEDNVDTHTNIFL